MKESQTIVAHRDYLHLIVDGNSVRLAQEDMEAQAGEQRITLHGRHELDCLIAALQNIRERLY